MIKNLGKALGVLASAAILISTLSAVAFAQTALEEGFDDVTIPALPSGWISQSLQGGQVATSSNLQSYTSPNSAFIPNPGVTSLTALLLPVLNISTGTATHSARLSFQHRRGMETNFDGGVLEISINGGAFVDVTDPSIGGTFNTGDYNSSGDNGALHLGSSNPLSGRLAWTSPSTVFESVELDIPSIPSDTPYQFRFLLGTDASVTSTGWFIDSLRLDVPVDSIVDVIPSATQVKAGSSVSYLLRLSNPSSMTISPGVFYVTAPSGELINGFTISSGFVSQLDSWTYVVQSLTSIPPFSSSEIELSLNTTNPPQSGAVIEVTQHDITQYIGGQIGVGFLSSSPTLPVGGLNNLPIFMAGGADLCADAISPSPPGVAGALMINTGGTCPVGQEALNAQLTGAAAFVRMTTFAPPPAPSLDGSSYVVEPPTIGLTIPAMVGEFYTFSIAGAQLLFTGAPGTTLASINGKNGALRRTTALNVLSLGGNDPNLGNNLRSILVDVFIDADNDGTADDSESCPADSAKQSPGACGCGIADADSNGNGVVDCLKTPDIRKDIEKLRSLIQSLKLNKFAKQKSVRNQIKAQRKLVGTRLGETGISISGPKINLIKLGGAIKKPVGLLVKNTDNFDANKKAALKAVSSLLKGLGA